MKSLLLSIIATIFFFSVAFADLPYYPVQFPRDHGSHFSNTPYPTPPQMLEWWYFSGNGESLDGKEIAFYFSAFKLHVVPYGVNRTWVLMGLTDATRNTYSSMPPTNTPTDQSTSSATDLNLNYNQQYTIERKELETPLFTQEYYLLQSKGQATDGDNFTFYLVMTPTQAPLLHGGNGLVDMIEGGNSYYYSVPKMLTTGVIVKGSNTYFLNPVKTNTWFDHQWGDFMPGQQFGWEWFAVTLKHGSVVMIQLNIDQTKAVQSGFVTIREKGMAPVYLTLDSSFAPVRSHYWTSPMTGISFPTEYDLTFPTVGLFLNITALIQNQDAGMYEGGSVISGTFHGHPITGFGSIELIYPWY